MYVKMAVSSYVQATQDPVRKTLVPKRLDNIVGRGWGYYMPRQPRLDAPRALHHVIGPDESGFPLCSNSSIDGIKIFRNRKDREDFLELLADLCRVNALSVYAWALISNHFHLILRTGNQPLSNSMRTLLT